MAAKNHFSTLKIILASVVAVLSCLSQTTSADQQQPSDNDTELIEMSLEELMKVPVVFSSSKRRQPITEAASGVTIVTAEDIKRSGATNIGDVLRSVAGLDVRESSASQRVIGIRGFADTTHVLVTIDGNSAFMYHANHIFLDWAPIGLEEIDRIEIIKGPGGIFYGGSAFSGVINIVTKTPEQLKGTQLNVTGGNWETVRSNIIHGGTYKNLDYSVAGGYRGSEEWQPAKRAEERDDYSVDYFAARTIYHLNDTSSVSLMGRHSGAENVISRVCNPDTTFLTARYDQPDFWVRLFYNNHEKTFWNDTYGVKDTNYELELLRTLRWGRNITSLGGYVKRTFWQVDGLQGPNAGKEEAHDVENYALNVENEHRFTDWLILTLGARIEHYSYLDLLSLGRASVIYKAKEDQTVRFTVANGYYIPSLFQQTNEGSVYPFALGNSSLKEERITSYELAYSTHLTSRAKLSASVFYNEYDNLIDNTQTGPTQNIADAHQHGGEVGVDFLLTDWLSGFANYTYQKSHRDDFGDLDVDPRNKCNLGLRAERGKWSANMTFHYVDRYYETYLTSNPVFGRLGAGPERVDAYNTVDCRVAYRANDHLELAVAASNLFNNRHNESNLTEWHAGDVIGRRVMASLSYKF